MVQYSFSLENFEIFILILVRVSCFVYIAPFYGMSNVPNQVKIGLSAMIALLVSGFADVSQVEYTGLIGYAVIVLKEGITGLLIGFAANICNSIVLFAGSVIDMDIGLSMAAEFNQDMGTEVTLTGNFYYYLVMILMITSNLHTYLIQAIADSFSVIPIAGQAFDMDHLLNTFARYMGDIFVLGFRIFLPIFACIMILNCVLGIMAKVAPQMNMFSVGMQLKVLVGFVVIFLTVFLLPDIANMILKEIKLMVRLIAEGMY